MTRRFVDVALGDVGVDRHLAALLVTEFVSNVVVHAGTPFTVAVHLGDVVRIEVQDGAAATEAFRQLVADPPSRVNTRAAGGRGWMLVSRLASNFGLTDNGPAGKTVWFELPMLPPPETRSGS